jgi:hypothetical protein
MVRDFALFKNSAYAFANLIEVLAKYKAQSDVGRPRYKFRNPMNYIVIQLYVSLTIDIGVICTNLSIAWGPHL